MTIIVNLFTFDELLLENKGYNLLTKLNPEIFLLLNCYCSYYYHKIKLLCLIVISLIILA